ncbi:hypothetical protein J6590_001443 [Homalodisca vitripennis]|nr:hypothetical protein J6590_001443 [Homalodisca vitripennis]
MREQSGSGAAAGGVAFFARLDSPPARYSEWLECVSVALVRTVTSQVFPTNLMVGEGQASFVGVSRKRCKALQLVSPFQNVEVMQSAPAAQADSVELFTFLFLQHLVSDAVSDLTPGIWSQACLKRPKESQRRRSSKRTFTSFRHEKHL